jgi:phosphinothricin acetyltransferase
VNLKARLLVMPTAALTARARRTGGLWTRRSTCIQGFGVADGKGLYVSLFGILAAQGYFNAFAGITLPNSGSVRLYESVGFEQIGLYRSIGYKLGRWHDVGWWQLTLRPQSKAPVAAMTLDECRRTQWWDQILAAGLAHIHDAT